MGAWLFVVFVTLVVSAVMHFVLFASGLSSRASMSGLRLTTDELAAERDGKMSRLFNTAIASLLATIVAGFTSAALYMQLRSGIYESVDAGEVLLAGITMGIIVMGVLWFAGVELYAAHLFIKEMRQDQPPLHAGAGPVLTVTRHKVRA